MKQKKRYLKDWLRKSTVLIYFTVYIDLDLLMQFEEIHFRIFQLCCIQRFISSVEITQKEARQLLIMYTALQHYVKFEDNHFKT